MIGISCEIDVGDGCWRQNVLVTDLIHWKNHQHNEKNHQHNDSVTNISNRSPLSSHQHNDVTNITVIYGNISPIFKNLPVQWWKPIKVPIVYCYYNYFNIILIKLLLECSINTFSTYFHWFSTVFKLAEKSKFVSVHKTASMHKSICINYFKSFLFYLFALNECNVFKI